MERIRVGIIGFGKIGRLRAELVTRHPAMELLAVADPAPTAEGLPDGCALHERAESLLREEVDAVFVCTPNAATAGLVIAALEAGKHVFAEKPPGRSLGEVEAILQAEARHPELKLKFGFNHREHESVRLAVSLVKSGDLGRLMWLRGVYGKCGGPDFEKNWRSNPGMAGGGVLLDQGIHMLDLFRLFAGDFDEVKSFVGERFWGIGLEDNAFALLRSSDGCVAMLHSSSTHWSHIFRLEIYLTEGFLVLNGFLTGTRTYGRETLVLGRRNWNDSDGARGNPREERYHFDEDRSWEREINDFANCILGGHKVLKGNSLDAIRAMELVSRIYGDDGRGFAS